MLEAVDLESKTVVLELEIVAHGFGLTKHCNCRDSDT
jgi:hypothetical protein